MIDFTIGKLTGDISINNSRVDLVTGSNEVVQRVKVRLGWLLNEWFLDSSKGLPWFQSILGKKDTAYASLLIRGAINDTSGVQRVNTLNLRFDESTRLLSIFAVIVVNNSEFTLNQGVNIG